MSNPEKQTTEDGPAETLRSGDLLGGLTSEQVERAKAWMLQHYHHVLFLAKSAEHSYAPTDAEDKRRPELWKAGHWHWFLATLPSPNGTSEPRGSNAPKS